MAPRHFDILATCAYVAFVVVVGHLVGGCWSVVVRAVRDAYEPRSLQRPGTHLGRWD